MGTQLSKSDDQLVAHPPAPSLPRPTLQSLPAELLSNIAFYLVLGQAQPGPPSSLIPLLLTHSTFNCLSFDNNPSLWARVFGATWDVSACLRRFASPGEQGVLADARLQADELRTRWTKLRVLREFAEDGRAWMRARQEKDAMDELEGAMIECWLILTENGTTLPLFLFSLSRADPSSSSALFPLSTDFPKTVVGQKKKDGRNLPHVLQWA